MNLTCTLRTGGILFVTFHLKSDKEIDQ